MLAASAVLSSRDLSASITRWCVLTVLPGPFLRQGLCSHSSRNSLQWNLFIADGAMGLFERSYLACICLSGSIRPDPSKNGLAGAECLSSGPCFGAKHTRSHTHWPAGLCQVSWLCLCLPLASLILLSLWPTKNWSTNNPIGLGSFAFKPAAVLG